MVAERLIIADVPNTRRLFPIYSINISLGSVATRMRRGDL